MLKEWGLVYSHLVNMNENMFLEVFGDIVKLGDWKGDEKQLWTRSWDNWLENKRDGRVLTVMEEDLVEMRPPMEIRRDLANSNADSQMAKNQKWKLDKRGRLVHKATNRTLDGGFGQLPILNDYGRNSQEWRFNCFQ